MAWNLDRAASMRGSRPLVVTGCHEGLDMINKRIWPFFLGVWATWLGLEVAHAHNLPFKFWFWGSWVVWTLFMITFWLRKRD